MALSAGKRLGPYEIVAPLGAGGMGEVYRARDTRLNREVAIKVLPDQPARDRDALERFQREAMAVAALAHPNILVLFDVGAEQDIQYAVTELLEGETLRACLDRGALPWRKSAEIGAAIAEGLAAAHARGIMHRDIKPANIFLTSDGRVKILDFGLAVQKPSLGPEDKTATHVLDDAELCRARWATCRRNSCAAKPPGRPAIFFRSDACCTKWSPGAGRSRVNRRPRLSRRCSKKSRPRLRIRVNRARRSWNGSSNAALRRIPRSGFIRRTTWRSLCEVFRVRAVCRWPRTPVRAGRGRIAAAYRGGAVDCGGSRFPFLAQSRRAGHRFARRTAVRQRRRRRAGGLVRRWHYGKSDQRSGPCSRREGDVAQCSRAL